LIGSHLAAAATLVVVALMATDRERSRYYDFSPKKRQANRKNAGWFLVDISGPGLE